MFQFAGLGQAEAFNARLSNFVPVQRQFIDVRIPNVPVQ